MSFLIQLIAIIHSNQQTTYIVAPDHSLTAINENTYRFNNKLQCVWHCRQNESCYAVNIRNNGDNYLCDALGISRFLSNDVGSETIGIIELLHVCLIGLVINMVNIYGQ